MFVCLCCGEIFEEPIIWEEKHGLDTPPYEQFLGSPCCGDTYAEAHKCDNCNEWITNNYIKVGSERYCENCYITYELGDEDENEY